MILTGFQAEAHILGARLEVFYDGGAAELRIAGLDYAQAIKLVELMEQGKPLERVSKRGDALPAVDFGRDDEDPTPAPPPPKHNFSGLDELKEETEAEEAPRRRRAPAIDPEQAQRIAAAAPAKPPKAEKAPKRKTKTVEDEEPAADATEPADDTEWEDNGSGVMVPKGHMERVAREHGMPAEAPGVASRRRKSEPEPEPEEAEEEAEEQEEAEDAAEEEEIPNELVGAKKLRDVVVYLMDNGFTDRDDLVAECERLKDAVPVLGRISDIPSRVDRTIEVLDMGNEALS